MNDDDVIPWGEHRGTRMDSLPATYCLHLLQQDWIQSWPHIYAYLDAHRDAYEGELGTVDHDDRPRRESSTFEDYLKDYRGF